MVKVVKIVGIVCEVMGRVVKGCNYMGKGGNSFKECWGCMRSSGKACYRLRLCLRGWGGL